MPMRTGEQVPRSIQQDDREETASLNELEVYGRSQDIQTQRFSLYKSGSGSQNYTMTDAVIITGVYLACNDDDVGANFSASASVTIAGNVVGKVSISGTDGYDNQSGFIPIPNWRIEKGEIITLSPTNGSCLVVGYYA